MYEAVRKVFGGKGEDFVVQQFGVEEQFGVDVPQEKAEEQAVVAEEEVVELLLQRSLLLSKNR